MRKLLLVVLIVMLSSHAAYCSDYTKEETEFRQKALGSLKPYGPGFNEEQREIWKGLIGLAAGHDDKGIVKAMFAAGERADGAMATQYAIDMFELYKKNPVFFASMVDMHYKGGVDRFLSIWINETGDVTAEEIAEQARKTVADIVLKEFVKRAYAMERAIFK